MTEIDVATPKRKSTEPRAPIKPAVMRVIISVSPGVFKHQECDTYGLHQ